MNFNAHSNLEGRHAFLSASKYSWTNYDAEKLEQAYFTWFATEIGTRLHAFAAEAIKLKIKLPRSRQTLAMFVNDAIGYRMTPEQPLYYSENCFGTADAISFNKNMLRVHDLKTGTTPTKFRQLEIYDALFCLEYHKDPFQIEIENRIYQMDEVHIQNPDPKVISMIMEKIIDFDLRIEQLKVGE